VLLFDKAAPAMPATILPSCQVQKESAKAKPMPTTKPAKLPKATGQRRLKHHGDLWMDIV